MRILLLLGLPIVVVGMWISVFAVLSYSGGWAKLASVYKAQRAPSGRHFPMQGAKIGDI
jgi:hypothetical protein